MLLGGPLAGLAANRPVCGGNAACRCAETHLDGETSPEPVKRIPQRRTAWEERCGHFLISSEAVYMINSEHRFECRLDMDMSPWTS